MAVKKGSEYVRVEGSEVKLLHFVFSQSNLDEIRGQPDKVLALIEEFGKEYWFANVGRPKGEIVVQLIKEKRPRYMIELGGYVGYSAIMFGDALRRCGGQHFYSLELNPEFAAVANMLIDLAGLSSVVSTLVGRSDESLKKLHTDGSIEKIELLFIDHYKPAYTTDLQLCEELGMISEGSVIAADNTVFPGNPPYLKYVRSSVEDKREAIRAAANETNRHRGFNTEGFSERTVSKYMGANSAPAYVVTGNPNLIYKSGPIQPKGDPDAVEITRCMGVQEEIE